MVADEFYISSGVSDVAEGAVKCSRGRAAFQHAPVKSTPVGRVPGET